MNVLIPIPKQQINTHLCADRGECLLKQIEETISLYELFVLGFNCFTPEEIYDKVFYGSYISIDNDELYDFLMRCCNLAINYRGIYLNDSTLFEWEILTMINNEYF